MDAERQLRNFRREGKRFPTLGWVFNPVVFGQVRTLQWRDLDSRVDAKRLLEEVKAHVVISAQDSATFARLIPIAEKQEKATQDALRITRENFQIGTGLFLDVLQTEDRRQSGARPTRKRDYERQQVPGEPFGRTRPLQTNAATPSPPNAGTA